MKSRRAQKRQKSTTKNPKSTGDAGPSSPPQPPGELGVLYKQVDSLDVAISKLNEERASVRRRINDMQSPVMSLPLEILSIILQDVCSSAIDIDDRWESEGHRWNWSGWDNFFKQSAPLVLQLSGISSYFRQVAFSTPMLWTTLAIKVDSKRVQDAANLLQFYLLHIGGLSLTLCLSATACSDTADLDPISNILFAPASAKKIKGLHLDSPPQAWLSLFSKHFIRLTDLSILRTNIYNARKIIKLRNLPSSSLNITLVKTNQRVNLPPSGIRSLYLENIPLKHATQLLRQTTSLASLVSLAIFDTNESSRGSYFSAVHNNADQFISFPHLKTFTTSLNFAPAYATHLLPILQYPNLETFNLYESHGSLVRQRGHFLANLPQNMHKIVLLDVLDWQVSDWKLFFDKVNKVREVVLHLPSDGAMISMLSTLTPGSRPESHRYPYYPLISGTSHTVDETKLYLPHLEQLNINTDSFSVYLEQSDLLPHILTMFRKRNPLTSTNKDLVDVSLKLKLSFIQTSDSDRTEGSASGTENIDPAYVNRIKDAAAKEEFSIDAEIVQLPASRTGAGRRHRNVGHALGIGAMGLPYTVGFGMNLGGNLGGLILGGSAGLSDDEDDMYTDWDDFDDDWGAFDHIYD